MARYVRQSSGLVRELRWWDVLFITVAAPTGSGILFYSVQTSGQPGGSIVMAFAIGMALFLPMVMASMLLASAMPRSGGPYVGISRLVHPAVGYLASCLLIIGDGIVVGVLGFILMQVGGATLSVVGQAYHLETLVRIGSGMGANPWAPLGTVAWVVIFWAIMLRSPTVFRRILAALLLLPLITVIFALIAFFMTPPGDAMRAFNELWGPQAWGRVLQAAHSAGWNSSSFSWNSTFSLLLVVVWAFNGIEFASYAGGEVQAPQRSYAKGLFLGWLSVGLLYTVTAVAVRHSFGEIIEPYHFLQANHPDQLASVMPSVAPSIPFYLLCILRSPELGILLAIAFVFWFVKIIPTVFLTTSRLMFALSMDRLLPEKLAEVHPVTAVPTWATHVTAVIALAGSGFYYFKVQTVLGILMFCTMFIAWPMGVALILLPLRRPDLIRVEWLKSPRVLGLPAASWLGVLATLSGLNLLYLAGREIPGKAWLILALVASVLLANYFLRTKASVTELAPSGDEAFLPPE
ncbi:MAG TPA: APC family permease [Thermoanaerobaculia bacterium]